MEKNKKRIMAGLAVMAGLSAALACRLFYIQVLCHDDFTETAQLQYEITIDGIDTRGQIFDRNMQPLTGGSSRWYYIIKESKADKKAVELFEKMDAEPAGSSRSGYKVYSTENYNEEMNRELTGEYSCYVFCSGARYEENQPACHLVGYLNDWDKKGVSGLEYMYDEKLAPSEERLVIMADAAGNILPGLEPEIKTSSGTEPADNSLVTTIDLQLQKKCESLLRGSSACVVSDAATGEILAMASSPVFSPDHIPEYLDQQSDCLINKTIQSAYPPGSVFKLVVAAAALENLPGAAARTLPCTGRATTGGVTVSCATAPDGGHGSLDMCQAMAKSCNCYFVQLGEELGEEKILKMAGKLGLGKSVLDGFPEETEGNIPAVTETGSRDISNISIGQGTILVTPMQITRMISIIANEGRYVPFSIVSEEVWMPSDPSEQRQVIREETALMLQSMMKEVMTCGTCSAQEWNFPVWGKSGTAEASLHGRPVKNCWLAGFCESSGMRYVITVFAEDGISGSATALPVFREIAEYLDNSKVYSSPRQSLSFSNARFSILETYDRLIPSISAISRCGSGSLPLSP